ncbi:NfrA family protein [Burkholderia sp. WSM2230]|uniref:NfrA family protein n=1 Tax=Burkholderia sp. WSM2230 TaxID=944435 RepID=UPI000421E589|nr:bacteriophage N4 adsorption protein A [Burkholderia sp. WSM2230]
MIDSILMRRAHALPAHAAQLAPRLRGLLTPTREARARLSGTCATPFVLRAIAAAAVAGALGLAPNVHAQSGAATVPNALPLSGAAYRVAQEAYAAYARGDYAGAVARTREAIRQRPDVVSLRVLLANSLAAQRRYGEASRSLGEAIAQLGPDPALTSRRKQIDALNVSTRAVVRGGRQQAGDPNALSGAALTAAQHAYKAYAAKDFAATVKYANDALALRPDLLRLHLLLIDAASAAGDDAGAWAANLDAVKRFGDNDELRLRRGFIGSRLAPKSAAASYEARKQGDDARAAALARGAVSYAPDRIGYRMQLIDALFAANDLPAVQAAASAAIADLSADDASLMPLTLRGYALAAQGHASDADADFVRALKVSHAGARDQRVARTIIADVWIAARDPQRALDLLAPLQANNDDTDAAIALRRARARAALAHPVAASLDPLRRPIIECLLDEYGSSCYVYPADPGFAAARAAQKASAAKNKTAALRDARDAVQAAPDDPQHRVQLIDALVAAGETREANDEARQMVDTGMLDALPDMTAAYIAQRAGNGRVAYERFSMADKAGALPPGAAADAGYAAMHAHRNREAAQYFERAIDASAAALPDTEGIATPTQSTPAQLNDIRSAHADVTRNWGFNASLNYRGAGMQPGYASSPTPGTSNNWQSGVEAYWRPFGSLGERMFEVYARGYESFGVKNGGATGVDTLQATVGARAKPLTQIDAIVAFERIIPIGSRVDPDWLARLAYSGGFGTERRVDVPAWWTTRIYAETGTYLNAGSVYATTNVQMGRTFRMDSYSPKWTVFPYLVVGADYDSSINHSIPLGAGVGISTRYWFRDSQYDAPRSYVDLSVQYRLKISGDERARGVFFGAVFAY